VWGLQVCTTTPGLTTFLQYKPFKRFAWHTHASNTQGAIRTNKITLSIKCFENTKKSKHWWLIPIILAIGEPEIGRIVAQCQPEQIVSETLSPK
jgi:hypothetical protein